MNDHPEHPYLYIDPLRSVFDRLNGKGVYEGKGVNFKMFTPVNYDSAGKYQDKIDSLQELIETGSNVMSTHQLFLSVTEQMIEAIRPRHYYLIIDEALDAITVLSKKRGEKNMDDGAENEDTRHIRQAVSRDDITFLLNHGLISVDKENGNRVIWNDADPEEADLQHRYAPVRDIIKTGSVFYNGDFLVWTFPARVLEAFDNIIVLTYRFQNSIMQAYLDYFKFEYTVKSLERREDGFELVPYNHTLIGGRAFSSLIDVCADDSLNNIGIRQPRGQYPFSANWYKTQKQNKTGKLKAAKNYLRTYFDRVKPEKDAVMWTCFKTFKNELKPRGYIQRADWKTETFASCNCRATEEYGDRSVLAYMVDRHLNPGITRFLAQNDVHINEDEYALSEMIQWIFRSRIRFVDRPESERRISIYIPSERMRNLLLSWLGRPIPRRFASGQLPSRTSPTLYNTPYMENKNDVEIST